MVRPDRPDSGAETPPPPPPGSFREPTRSAAQPPLKPPMDAGAGGTKSNAGRNVLLSILLVAVLAIVLGSRMFHSGGASLPEPTGQVFTTDYKAATLSAQPAPTTPMPLDHSNWNTCASGAASKKLSDLDMVLVIDTTGSMQGVIDDVKANAIQLINALQTGGGSVRVGVVAYRDVGDDYVVRPFPLTDVGAGAPALVSFIAGLQASGGGDWPEKVEAGVQTAASMDWRRGVPGSIVVIGDAPAHPEAQSAALAAAKSFARAGGHQVSVIDAGSGANPFMKSLPESGHGQYVTYDGNILNSLYPAITACPTK